MKALVHDGNGHIALEDRPEPQLQSPTDAIVRVTRSTICTSDLHIKHGSVPRAVGQACGDNWFPILIPCHRVVSASGIGGFSHHTDGYLLNIKHWLLRHEGVMLI